jgi:two-component system sensor kinase FixL
MAGKDSQRLDAQPPSAHANSVAALGKTSAAIVRELNQPLTIIALDAEASLQWLARQNPNIPEAIRSIRHILRDVQRASRVAGQIRSLVANSSN